ncbi:hypothetical protein [Bradyrhizobium sp. SYSU BS000235]|uniref:hypothetical protein n=1 Tax=Bradyrhizobium sp. SYSU BS000235 TaxID=3411332 RepID=UPI003C70900C
MTDVKVAYDAATLATLRHVLDQVLTHPLFLNAASVSALQMAEHILSLAAAGERDIERLRNSALSILASGKAA